MRCDKRDRFVRLKTTTVVFTEKRVEERDDTRKERDERNDTRTKRNNRNKQTNKQKQKQKTSKQTKNKQKNKKQKNTTKKPIITTTRKKRVRERRKCTLRHQPTIFGSSFLKSERRWMCLELKLRAERYFRCRAQGLFESGGGRPGLPVPNSPYGLCGRKATLNLNLFLLNDADFHTNVTIDTIFYVFKLTCVFDISRFDTISDNARLTKNGVI